MKQPNTPHKVHELKKQAVLHLYSETHVYNDFPGTDFDRIVIMTMKSEILDDMDDITYFACFDRRT